MTLCATLSPIWHELFSPFDHCLSQTEGSSSQLPNQLIYYVECNKCSGDIAQFDLLIHIKGLALILYLENTIICSIRDCRSQAACILASATLEEATGSRKCRKR